MVPLSMTLRDPDSDFKVVVYSSHKRCKIQSHSYTTTVTILNVIHVVQITQLIAYILDQISIKSLST